MSDIPWWALVVGTMVASAPLVLVLVFYLVVVLGAGNE
jgi:hypothetical protein